MKIERLKLINYRNYSELDIMLNDGINLFIGDNGQGKTNILESIYVLSLSKSNKYGNEENLIKFNEKMTKIEGFIKRGSLLKKLDIHITRDNKNLFINNKEIRKVKNYISNFCVIAFTPSDLDIIKGSPQIRRNTINVDISQLSNDYVSYLNEYNQIIKIRNEYLKKMNLNGNTDIRYLEIINEKMIENAVKIYNYRYKFFYKINERITKIFKQITGLNNLKINYINSVKSIEIDEYNEEKIIIAYKEKLKKNFNIELMQGVTLFGPHRDDFMFRIDDMEMRNYSSQGQQRMAVISFKIAEIYLFKDMINEYPVLLLDDIFSEIDSKKRNKIIKYLNNDIQSIITTTDMSDIDEKLLINAQVFCVKNNKVIRKVRNNNGRGKGTSKL